MKFKKIYIIALCCSSVVFSAALFSQESLKNGSLIVESIGIDNICIKKNGQILPAEAIQLELMKAYSDLDFMKALISKVKEQNQDAQILFGIIANKVMPPLEKRAAYRFLLSDFENQKIRIKYPSPLLRSVYYDAAIYLNPEKYKNTGFDGFPDDCARVKELKAKVSKSAGAKSSQNGDVEVSRSASNQNSGLKTNELIRALDIFDDIKKAAETGDANAQNELGRCYANGYLIKQDYKKAFEWFKKAAEQNYSKAQHYLGFCYFGNLGVARDMNLAFEWAMKSAKQNNAEAQCALAKCYLAGMGYEKDLKKACIWFEKAANQNFAEAQTFLGIFYIEGNGVEKDAQKGFGYLLNAANQNNADAQKFVAMCYNEGLGVEKDLSKAKKWKNIADESELKK